MKKTICLILSVILICLLFASCTGIKRDDEETIPDGLYFSLSSLPNIGEYKPLGKAKYYYKDGAKNCFEPGDGYGTIVPYIVSKKMFTSQYSFDGEADNRSEVEIYGLATAEGKIITSGIYYGCCSFEFRSGKRFYMLKKRADENRADEYSEGYDFISEDGKICFGTEVIDAMEMVFPSEMPNDCIAIPEVDGLKLYNDKGELVINLTEIFGADCYLRVHYADVDKYIIAASAEIDETWVTKYYCIDKKGTLLYELDWSDYSIEYCDGGRFILEKYDEKGLLCDLFGEMIELPGEYCSIEFDKRTHNYTGKNLKDDCIDVFNSQGELQNRIDYEGSIYSVSSRILLGAGQDSIISYESSDNFIYNWVNLESGEKYIIEEKDVETLDFMEKDGHDYVIAVCPKECSIYDSEGTFIRSIKRSAYDNGSIDDGYLMYIGDDGMLNAINLLSGKNTKLETNTGNISARTNLFAKRGDNIELSSYDDSGSSIFVYYSLSQGRAITPVLTDATAVFSSAGLYIQSSTEAGFDLINGNGEVIISIQNNNMI